VFPAKNNPVARVLGATVVLTAAWLFWLPDVRPLKKNPPKTTAYIELRRREAAAQGRTLNVRWTWVGYDSISKNLREAVVTAEDDTFYRHNGVDRDALSAALQQDLKAGRLSVGGSTITMQLARNLWLGHRRTLARKGQEVALAWLIEHLAGLTKERLLEIYLNIIEWGPQVHGADEAARYYFDEDAGQLTLPEALFLTIVVPSPTKWRWRFAPDGTLRPFARAQMHFIANKMAAKGWLNPAEVLPADSLHVTLRGPARALFAARDTVAVADSSEAAPF